MTVPKTLPAPRRNLTTAGLGDRLDNIAAADIIVAVGDYTGGAAANLFTLAAHGLVDGDIVHCLWQSAMGALTGGEGTRCVVDSLSSSTFTLTSDGTTAIANTADGTVIFLKTTGGVPQRVVDATINALIVGAGDENGGATDDVFVPAQGTKGLYEADTMKLLYKSAAGVLTGIAADATAYAKAPTVTYFQMAATSGGAAIVNTADGTAVFLKTS